VKIWIDGYEANVANRVGSGQYAFEVVKNLEKIDTKNEYLILLPEKPIDELPRERPGWKYKILKPKKLWTRIALPLALYSTKQKPDLFFSPTHYIPRFSPVKVIVSIFDLAYFHFPEFFKKDDLYKLKNWTKYSVNEAAAILTISKSTKNDLVKFYGIKPEKITITYPGFKESIYHPVGKKEIEEVTEKYKISGNYIIYIGTVQPRKNLARLIEALSRIDNLKLVVVGKTTGIGRQGWMFEEVLELPKKLNIEDRVIFTGFVPDKEVNQLLNGALAFAFPSLYEGFGIPVVDSMAAGVPVITSKVSSMPEAAGKAALLVDPYSTDQIEQAIRTVTTDKAIRQRYSKLGLKQAKKFSWKKCAEETLKVFGSVVN
jgi:glycosyltransferase involved in cell wall biosynthesis